MELNIEEVKKAIHESSLETKIYIGSDSKVIKTRKGRRVKYCTVVILHYDGKHGGKIFSDIRTENFYGDARAPKLRLLGEVQRCVEIGYEVLDAIGPRDFEVHLDLNTSPEHKSNLAVKEALGYVMGTLGVTAKLKPDAFAASTAADLGCQ